MKYTANILCVGGFPIENGGVYETVCVCVCVCVCVYHSNSKFIFLFLQHHHQQVFGCGAEVEKRFSFS